VDSVDCRDACNESKHHDLPRALEKPHDAQLVWGRAATSQYNVDEIAKSQDDDSEDEDVKLVADFDWFEEIQWAKGGNPRRRGGNQNEE
jgi:hypothetical protein